ncbi:hypothetical protein TeGR_g14949 [Tetraparma gracilis]|uniref:PNPLA domain-containing protein n=1 Tax=Tetraparma gracilis TaxID=2962635 RepID=A0ABQ6MQW8_9STRA|nr:hypothetical protein TeGR_g14949 [Tetraparma gracilis]
MLGPPAPTLALPGGGIYFYHIAGQLTYLRERLPAFSSSAPPGYNLVGASAGSLAAALFCYGVDFEEATALAVRQAEDFGLFERPLGLAGVWGQLVDQWLEGLIPAEGAGFELPSNLGLLVTPATPGALFGDEPRAQVREFRTRRDLIDACMSSVHIPFFMDKQPARSFRGEPVIDGSFRSRPSDYSFSGSAAESVVFLDYKGDEKLGQTAGGFVKLVTPDGVYKMMELGYDFAAKRHSAGDFRAFEEI